MSVAQNASDFDTTPTFQLCWEEQHADMSVISSSDYAKGEAAKAAKAGAAINDCLSETLTSKQRIIAERAIYGEQNIFLTGAAGVGKSYLLRFIIDKLTQLYASPVSNHSNSCIHVAVTASTGIAALHISGQTIHSFAGIGLGIGTREKLYDSLRADARRRWQGCKCLIIDEISMISAELFDKLDYIARRCRKSAAPFGGIRLILSGDFFQLPPVDLMKGSIHAGFAFQSDAWPEAAIVKCELTEVVRQSDADFIGLLNQIRLGVCSDDVAAALKKCHVNTKSFPDDGIAPTKLYCTNKNVDVENTSMLLALQAPQHDFKCIDSWVELGRCTNTKTSNARALLLTLASQRVPEVLSLRVGAQVMYTKNSSGLVNGSRGVVVAFERKSCTGAYETGEQASSTLHYYPVVQFDTGAVVHVFPCPMEFKTPNAGLLRRTQIPLRLSWALTIHKSQGMTLTRVQVDAGSAFECGQVYVALSRAASIKGLYIAGRYIDQSVVRVNRDVFNFYKNNSE